MAEYLSPGVYVEQTSYRAKSIEGVSTTTTGFVGQALYGPAEGQPVLVTSFVEFERRFQGFEPLKIEGAEQTNYLAHSVRAFFDNGGRRCYIARIFESGEDDGHATSGEIVGSGGDAVQFRARFPGRAGNATVEVRAVRGNDALIEGNGTARLRGVRQGDLVELRSEEVATGRIPALVPENELEETFEVLDDGSGDAGDDDGSERLLLVADQELSGDDEDEIVIELARSPLARRIVIYDDDGGSRGDEIGAAELQPGEDNEDITVELDDTANVSDNDTLYAVMEEAEDEALDVDDVYYVEIGSDGKITLKDVDSSDDEPLDELDDGRYVYPLSLEVDVTFGLRGRRRTDNYRGLSTAPESPDYIGRVMRHEDPERGIEPPYNRAAAVYLDDPEDLIAGDSSSEDFRTLLEALLDEDTELDTTGGNDGAAVDAESFRGSGEGHEATGLKALGEQSDIALIVAPGSSALDDAEQRQAARNHIITHCERHRYRFALLSGPVQADTATIREERAKHDTQFAAMYYPWVVVDDPLGSTGDTLELPPEGFIAGICARSDNERGVHKAPANEVVRGALRFNRHVTTGIQDVLNPEGINCLRFFEGRGNLVWGARTMSSDTEWRYVNVRRLFIYLEHSIDRNTQWAVFEPNNHTLWLKIRLTIESFLKNEQAKGALMGREPDEGFFVKCDRSTMTQQDLDQGRLVALVGVAPTKPAEFVVFRIGQWTAEASIV